MSRSLNSVLIERSLQALSQQSATVNYCLNKMHLFYQIIFSILFGFCENYKILAVFPMPFHSHYSIASTILKGLAKKGHQVTVVSPYPQEKPVENLQDVFFQPIIEIINERKEHLFSLETQSFFGSVKFLTEMGLTVTEETLKDKYVQKILKSHEKYDLIILGQYLNEGLIGIAHRLKAPVVLISPMPLFPWAYFLHSHPTTSAYIPNLLSPFTGKMNFWQRILNSYYDSIAILYHHWIILPKHRELVEKYIGKEDLYDSTYNVSLVLVNSHLGVHEAIPQPPHFIEIGGFHIQPPKPLPDHLQNILDESKDGVVVFSMGSNLKSSNLPEFQRNAIIKVFSRLKQNVIWKWETEDMDGKPANVKLMKWLPQSDILAHPNVQVFITHGGLLSTMESVYRGVPVIGIPIFSDQRLNMASATAHGYGVTLSLQELDEEKLAKALNEILNNLKYKENARKKSKIMQDQDMDPMDKAMFWIEYVARHEGAPHLRYAGADLAWYQRYLLDVAAFAFFSVIGVIAVLYVILRRFVNLFIGQRFSISKKND